MSPIDPPEDAALPRTVESADWRSLARTAALGRAKPAEPSLLRELLVFFLDFAPYAVPVERVREIVRMRPITPLPGAPEIIRGVISLRGEIVQVIDLRRTLRLSSIEPTRSSRIIVIHGEDGHVAGVLVDAVTEVLRVPEEAFRPAPPDESSAIESLCVHGDEFVALLDLERVLSHE